MNATCFRRFRMEVGLSGVSHADPPLPEGYYWHPWHATLLGRHALVKRSSFLREIDARLFPNLRELEGCLKLMREIVRQENFLPQATWLICRDSGFDGEESDCGTIQGLAHPGGLGAIQNVGVDPAHRGLGLGRALVLKALRGFRAAGLKRAYLEVTAENRPAVELYRSLGFRLVKTTYKEIDAEPVAV